MVHTNYRKVFPSHNSKLKGHISHPTIPQNWCSATSCSPVFVQMVSANSRVYSNFALACGNHGEPELSLRPYYACQLTATCDGIRISVRCQLYCCHEMLWEIASKVLTPATLPFWSTRASYPILKRRSWVSVNPNMFLVSCTLPSPEICTVKLYL